MEVEELHDRGISRRELLRRAGAAGVAVAGPLALALKDSGVPSDVYESSSRVAGRTHSDLASADLKPLDG